MQSCGAKCPLSDRDEEIQEDSPEYLLPVKDPYSSDDDKGKLFRSTKINSSDCTLIEVAYYFKFEYESYKSEKEMIGIPPHELFAEFMTFCYPEGLPSFYYPKYFLKRFKGMDYKCKVLYDKFMDFELNGWLEEDFNTDYSIATDKEICEQDRQIFETFKSCGKNQGDIPPDGPIDKKPACCLAQRIHNLLVFLRKDQTKRCGAKNRCKDARDEKYDLIKGVLYDILKYLDIQVMYNGESRLDFTCKIDPNDAARKHCFKVKPAALGYTLHGYESRSDRVDIFSSKREPYLVFEVFDSSSAQLLDKTTQSVSKSSLSNEEIKSDLDGINESDKVVSPLNENCNKELSSNIPSISKSTSVTSDQVTKDMSSLKIHKHIRESDDLDDLINIQQMHNHITSCGPEACCSEKKANKLYGQFALQLYGSLMQRNSLLDSNKKKNIRAKRDADGTNDIFGFFIMNEYIYLAKISGPLSDTQKPENVTLTYAHNVWFNLNKPNDRLAFLCSLFHLDQIRVKQASIENGNQKM